MYHVHDALFRYASLRAGLSIDVESRVWRFLAPRAYEQVDADEARAVLVRRFLHLAGPSTPAHLASWLALTPAAAGRWWSLVPDELAQVAVDGRKFWMLNTDAEALADPPVPDPLRLLGPYDPLTETAERTVAVPDAVERRRVWAAAANPGIVVRDGEIAGIWRRKTARGRLTLTVAPFDPLPSGWETRLADDAATIAASAGASDVQVVLAP